MVATLETEKGISYFVEGSKLKLKGKFCIDGNEIGELTDFTYTPCNITGTNNSWIFDMPGNITGKLKVAWKVAWKDKIDAALGFTHYAKKGKLFRKKRGGE